MHSLPTLSSHSLADSTGDNFWASGPPSNPVWLADLPSTLLSRAYTHFRGPHPTLLFPSSDAVLHIVLLVVCIVLYITESLLALHKTSLFTPEAL